MKKTISILLTIILTLSLAACAAKSPAANGDIGVDSAKALLDTVWSSYSEDEKFPAAGGDFSEENMTDGAPGAYSVADASELDRVFGLPEADGAQVDDAASLQHMMNANTFTCGAFHLKSGADAAAIAEATRANIQNRQWLCGFPDKLAVAVVGDYLVALFGAEDLVNTFTAKLSAAFPATQIVADEAIM